MKARSSPFCLAAPQPYVREEYGVTPFCPVAVLVANGLKGRSDLIVDVSSALPAPTRRGGRLATGRTRARASTLDIRLGFPDDSRWSFWSEHWQREIG